MAKRDGAGTGTKRTGKGRSKVGVLLAQDGTPLRVDAEDGEAVAAHTWHVQPDPATGLAWYAAHEGGRTLYLGTFVLGLHGQAVGEDQTVLHRNGDRGDARKENLKVLRLSTAMHRREVPKRGGKGQTDYIGVNELLRHGEPRGMYLAKISQDNETVGLGVYPLPEMAARAYDRAARQLHGKEARLNFPK